MIIQIEWKKLKDSNQNWNVDSSCSGIVKSRRAGSDIPGSWRGRSWKNKNLNEWITMTRIWYFAMESESTLKYDYIIWKWESRLLKRDDSKKIRFEISSISIEPKFWMEISFEPF